MAMPESCPKRIRAFAAFVFASAISFCVHAEPLSYFVNFTGAGTQPAVGLFTYDASAASFSNFSVSWGGHLFDLTAAANAPTVGGGCPGASSSAATGFALMSKSLCAGLYDRWFAGEDFASSRFAFSSQTLALPEKNAARISVTGAGSGAFPSITASGDWTLGAPFKAPGGTPVILADGTVFFPGGGVFIEGKGLVKVNHLVSFSGGGVLPQLGLFDYDASTTTFKNFFVFWNDHVFDLTDAANATSVSGGCPGTPPGAATGFALMSKTLCAGLYDRWFAGDEFGGSRFAFSSQTLALPELNAARISVSGPGSGGFERVTASGDWTLIALAPVPEPSTSLLLLAGLVILAARRPRHNRSAAKPRTRRLPRCC